MKKIPEKMTAVEIVDFGGPECLQKTHRNVPRLAENDVLIKVHACGINRPDIMQRSGLYPPPSNASDLPGLEVAGEIVSLGLNTRGWKIGQKVCALVNGGGYAEYVNVPGSQCLPIPDNVSIIEAASLPETFFTVWINVFERAKLKQSESLLVQGGASGIGVTAIQLARAMGCEVYATAGTDDKCRKCEELGAKKGINYNKEDFSSVVLAETTGEGVNVILDMVAGDYIQRELDCLATDGRLAIIAFLRGVHTKINLTDILKRRLSISGSTLRPRSTEFKGHIARQLFEKVWPLISSGEITPIIDKTFPLEDASSAHKYMESGNHFGKIVLTV